MKIKIYYDGHCPFCRNYVQLLDLRRNVESVDLIDLREDTDSKAVFTEYGYDLDSGMVVDVDGRFHHGKDAAAILAELSEQNTLVLKLNRLLFRSNAFSGLVYSVMRMVRDATLFLLNRDKLSDNSRYSNNITIFSFFFGVFCLLHFLVYAYQFRLPLYFSTFLVPVLGLSLLLNPESRRLLACVVLVLFIDGVLQAPVFSNHTILKNFIVIAMVSSALYSWLLSKGGTGFYLPFSSVGRGLLLTMYFFGVFHKINEDFLDPSVSCAVALWKDMPFYFPELDGFFWGYVKSYGTLLIESLIFICLISRRFRNWGVVFGVSFHSILAMSGYALYAPFSMLTVTLHLLFLSPSHANEIIGSESWGYIKKSLKNNKVRFLVIGYFFVLACLAYLSQYSAVGLLWILAMILPYRAIFSLRKYEDEWSVPDVFLSRPVAFNLIVLIFFFNCFSPYLGLKTSQSMNMFANLRLEGSQSNHYIMGVPAPFDYLEDLVRIEAPGSDPFLKYISEQDLRLVYYDFINYLERNRELEVAYSRNGVTQSIGGYRDVPEQDKSILHPRWVRAWLHFTPVDLGTPKECALDR